MVQSIRDSVVNRLQITSGGSGVTFTDGSATVSNATQLTVSGGVISGSTPNATLTISGSPGGSSGQVQYNNSGAFGGFTVSGDGTLNTGTGALTVTKVNGVSYGTSPSTNTVPVVTGSNTITYEAVPNAALANSSVTLSGHSLSLGGTLNLTSSDVGLGNVTNNAQTQAAIVPNTAPSAGQILAGNAGGTAYAPVSMSGDATLASTGAITFATVNSNTGSFGSSTSIPTFTVNAKGLITAASGNVVVAPAGTLTGTTLASNVVTSSLTAVGALASGSLTTGFTAVNPAQGGTGNATLTAHAVLLGEGTSAVAFATIGTSGRALLDQGAGADPAFTAISGDATLAGSGALTIANNAITSAKINANAVTFAKIQTSVANSLLGFDGSGNAADITLTTTGSSGAATISGGVLNIPQYSGGGGSTNLGLVYAFAAGNLTM